ncbi:cysteine desulfurase family protein [Nguyenibacter vanlangensis]|uniref:Cysteine desulfurase n=1 Tax=Nguyenibacter vanlangensis TaxID=1216886 RepID=A0ABZ3DA74_9PROT
MSGAIYLDGLSTAPLAPEARAAMLAAWDQPGNPSSPHAAGERAAALVETARRSVADLVGASSAEIVFTSGATEANNLAIAGAAAAAITGGSERRHVVVTSIEHKSVLEAAWRLRAVGFTVDIAPVTKAGVVDLGELAALIRNDTLLVSVMAANNETAVLQPIAEVAALAHAVGALLHCDAAQAVGKVPVDVIDLDVDFMSVSSHKMYGPMGVGALYVSAAAPRPTPLLVGGGQENGLRAGTEPAPLIAGFGTAAEVARSRLEKDARHAKSLLGAFLQDLSERQVKIHVNGNVSKLLPGAINISIDGIDAQSLAMIMARTVMISTGSACNSGQINSSHVLDAMDVDEKRKKEALRICFGRYHSDPDAREAARQLGDAINRMR